MNVIGLIVNPAAGRDIRRLAGGAVVSDNYAKRHVAAAVLEGTTLAATPPEVLVMPDRAGLGEAAVEAAGDDVDASLLEMQISGTASDTRRAAARLGREADAVVVLGGDGTARDVTTEVGAVPVVAVSTGTNNVVPTHVDGTVAGGAAALVAAGVVDSAEATRRHGTVRADVEHAGGRESLTGLVTLGVVDRPFVGTRAILHGRDFLGGVVSQAAPQDIGLSGVVGTVAPHAADAAGGVGVRLGPAESADRVVRAITVPGVVEELGVESVTRLAVGESLTFEVPEGVLSVDGERELEVTDATCELAPGGDGPRIVDVERTYAAAAAVDYFSSGPRQG
ncbi:MAG: NAD(+)/NADH kinase [Haloferacaceae archaeon]